MTAVEDVDSHGLSGRTWLMDTSRSFRHSRITIYRRDFEQRPAFLRPLWWIVVRGIMASHRRRGPESQRQT